ncbi:DUF1566 domain-containing protein [Massilia sp. TWP1-3-3]|uniref:Lcl C-terminal domain-containing protein n=1 Tax=Massilia sp. TWP1-3-3 TaxID=2804573 RepID=UPI003CF669F1
MRCLHTANKRGHAPAIMVRRSLIGTALVLLSACGGGGGGGSAPAQPPVVVPPPPDVLAVNSGVAIQGLTGEAVLSFRPALLAAATYPVGMSFTITGATGGIACSPGVDFFVVAASNVSATPAASTTGRLTLDAGSVNRQVDLAICSGAGSADKTLSFAWNDGNASGVASGLLRASASSTLELSKRINDTGITTCASLAAVGLACPQAGLAGQDAELGRDGTAAITGQGGFRVSAFMLTTLPNSSCVQDGVTGLVWEGKTASGLHSANATYTWRSAAAANGGAIGTGNGGVCTGSVCDTDAFVAAANSERTCGFSDWRLPHADELSGIVDSGASAAPTIPAAFANQAAATYWTDSPKAGDSAGAWAVDFNSGAVTAQAKSTANRIRLVRGR